MNLALRTDTATTELYLVDVDGEIIAGDMWESGRRLADELLPHITQLLVDNKAELSDITGIIIFSGPGSFTGLRIGHTVANALADSLGVPVVSRREDGWITDGCKAIQDGATDKVALPFYGADANITKPKA